jgi:hypothetical protein
MESLQKNRGKVKRYARLMKVANWIARIPDRVTPPPFRLLQIGSAFWQSRALYVAVRLGLADELGDAEKTTRAIAEARSLNEDHLYRLMRMLASVGVFTETAHRTFANSKMSAYLRSDHPESLRAMILMHNAPVMTRPWTESLEECIRSGETPFVKANGAELYEYMDRDEEFSRLFSQAMDSVEALTGSDYLGDFDWDRFDRVIDVGGSNGSKSLAILQSNPRLRALVFDRPSVVGHARAHWQGRADPGVVARMEFVGGSMFEAIPSAASDKDIYMFVAVFHGLDDEDAQVVLHALNRAIGDTNAAVLVVDAVAARTGVDPTIASFDMQMLIGTRGRERTLAEWTALFGKAGFSIREVVDVRTFAKFIVLHAM